MRNLKKVLTLVLTVAMLLSVMVVGTGAAFSDQDQIKNAEAVDACTSLNIIGGFPDGSYRPTNNVTRAEMCKMICVLLNGGKEPTLGTNATPTFTDVRGTSGAWAEAYIESCNSLGIVSGVGGGRFNPNGSITGTQAARMLLVALGFNAENEKFTGSSWAVNVNVRATQKGLYKGIETIDTNAVLTRDNAAQMIWNALDATMVTYKNEFTTGANGQIIATPVLADKMDSNSKYSVTLLEDKYTGTTWEGVLVGSGSYEAAKDKLKIAVRNRNGVSWAPDKGESNELLFKYTKDVTDLLGQDVKILVNNKNEVYGVFPVEDENTVVTASFSDVKKISNDKVKVDGTEYKYESDAVIHGLTKTEDGKQVDLPISDLKTSAYNSADVITFISNDGDEKFDVAYVNPIKSVSKVTYVSSNGFTAGGTPYDFADVIAPSDLAKNDYVVQSKDLFTGNDEFVKADTVKGKVTSTKGNVTDIAVDGNWYQVAASGNNNVAFTNMVQLLSGDALALKDTFTLQVVNGVVYHAKKEAGGSSDTALLIGASSNLDIDGNTQVQLLFADGTKKVVPAAKDYSTLNTLNGTTGHDKAFVTYEIEDGAYKLTTINNTNNLGDGNTYGSNTRAGFVKSTKKLDGKRVADSAVIYVQYKDGDKTKTSVISGKDLNAMGSNFGSACYYVLDGSTVCAALITADTYLPGASAGKLYGYVTSDVVSNNEDGTAYKSFTVWTDKNESVDVKMKSTTSLEKGDIISFELAADNFIEGVKELTGTTAAIKDFGTDYAIFYKNGETGATDLTFDDDVKFLYLNTKDKTGVNGGELAKADEYTVNNAEDTYYANCVYVTEGTGTDEKIVLIAIDTNMNQWDGADHIVNKTSTPTPPAS